MTSRSVIGTANIDINHGPSGLRNKTSRHKKRQCPSVARLASITSVDFLAAAEHQNYTHAAGVAGVHASTLSRRVRQLEDDLGVSLFNGTAKGFD